MFNDKSIEIFSSRDKIREQIIDLTKDYLKLENYDFSKTDYLSYLVNTLSVLSSNLIYYNTSVYKEIFLTQAVQRSSVLNWSSILGYTPPLAIPSLCSVLIQIPYDSTSTTERIIDFIGRNHYTESNDDIDKPIFKTYSKSGIPFSLTETAKVEINSSGVKVSQQNFINNDPTLYTGWRTVEHRYVNGKIQFLLDFIQLIDITDKFTVPELLPNEFFNLKFNFEKNGSIADIDLFSLSTNINSVVEKWERRQSIFGAAADQSIFTYREKEKGIVVSFGNGLIGKQPKKGSEIIINVGLTAGYNGNVIAGSITKSDPLRMLVSDGTNSTIKNLNISVINNEPSIFGEDPLSIDEIRSNAINRVSTNSRLVSANDFKNANLVSQNLPINNVYQVLKRSDLKRNEISLFSELLYETSIAPTRNIHIPDIVIGDTTAYEIKSNTTFVYDEEEYISLFDISINKYTRDVNYTYIISETQKPVTVNKTKVTLEPTKILPIFAEFITDRSVVDETLDIMLHCNKLDTTTLYYCTMSVDWPGTNGVQTYLLNDKTSPLNDSSGIALFSTEFDSSSPDYRILLSEVPEGDRVEFTFKIFAPGSLTDLTGGPLLSDDTLLNQSFTNVIIKRDLSDFMYSQLSEIIDIDETTSIDTTSFTVYDIPVIKKDYYNNLINKNLFTNNVLQKVVEFDIYDYKMITDFVNLKFVNSTGYARNMQYNKLTRDPVIDINPLTIPSNPVEGDRYALSDIQNPWANSSEHSITTGGYIAHYKNDVWTFERIKTNDFFKVTNFEGSDTSSLKMIFTGDNKIVEPVFSIPLEIEIDVFPSNNLTVTDQLLVKIVKDTLVNKLAINFGYNVSLYKSQITDIVMSIAGVRNVRVIKPEFDIFYDPDVYSRLTQEELLLYSPELLFFSTSNIIVNIRN